MTSRPRRSRPSYEGRVLPRPEEDVEDQGLEFDLGTLSRRRMLFSLGGGLSALTLAACSSAISDDSASGSSATSSSATGEIPDETAGPYPGDGSNGPDVLAESGIVRRDIRSSFGTGNATAEGVPMTIELSLKNLAKDSAAYAGVAVYAWHCNRAGEYSLYSSGIENENYLRGVQIADASGKVSFTSIFPACYSGRWPHIHFEVYPDRASISDASNAISTSQVALPQAACDAVYATSGYESSVPNLADVTLASDNVFGEDSGALQLATATGDTTSGYTMSLTASIDPDTEPAAGGGRPAAASR